MKRIAAIFAVAAVALTARAQNLNPTVEVTNIYEGAVTLADKPEAAMTVPDSVTVFNLDFDYSTFERPYMGAYDFTPYLIALKPSPSASSPSKLFVKAGAGFRLRPEAEIVWTPKVRGDFHPGVYASLDSYFGNYNKIVAKEGRLVPDGYFNGFDASVKAGTNGAWFFPRAIFSYDLHYNGIFTKDPLKMRPVNMAEGTVRLRSADGRPERFFYDAAFSYRRASVRTQGAPLHLRQHLRLRPQRHPPLLARHRCPCFRHRGALLRLRRHTPFHSEIPSGEGPLASGRRRGAFRHDGLRPK